MALDIVARAMAKGIDKKLTEKIENLDILTREIVDSLPTTNISTKIIYMIPKENPSLQNIYDEYINIDGTETGWEHIGSTEVNLNDYIQYDNLIAGENINLKRENKNIVINNTQEVLMDFPSWVVTDKTMVELINSFDENLTKTGIIFLGGITCSDLPAGIGNAELKVEVIKNSMDKTVYYFTIISTNVSPYMWTATGYLGKFSGWAARPTDSTMNTFVKSLIVDNVSTEDSFKILSANQGYILNTKIEQKADNWTIVNDSTITTLEIANLKDIRLIDSDIVSLTISLPTVVPETLECCFSFKSGQTATTLKNISSIKWHGVDCNENYEFIPTSNKVYEVYIKNVGGEGNDAILVARVGVC